MDLDTVCVRLKISTFYKYDVQAHINQYFLEKQKHSPINECHKLFKMLGVNSYLA